MFCPKCGTENDENNYKCIHCGEVLPRGDQPAAGQAVESGVEALIPYRNAPALVAYYCGVFALIPCVGIVLGIVAIVAGVLGLRRSGEHPEAKGKVHAWVGILLGGLVVAGHIAAIIAIGAAAAR